MKSLLERKKLFIFDLDGTLIDAYKAIANSLNYTLKRLGYKRVSFYRIKRSVGRGDRAFIETFFLEKDVEKALGIYRQHHEKSLLKYSELKPYASFVLDYLKRKKKIIALASNRPERFSRLVLKRLGIERFFDIILCADQISSHKPSPEILYKIMERFKIKPPAAVFIGDMDIDLETARRAKVDAIFIKGGSSTLREVKAYKDKMVIGCLKDILKV